MGDPSRTGYVRGRIHIPRQDYKAEIRDLYRRRPLTYFDTGDTGTEEPVIGTADEQYAITHAFVPYHVTPEGKVSIGPWSGIPMNLPIARVGEWFVLQSDDPDGNPYRKGPFITFVEAWRALDGYMRQRGE